MAKAKNTAARVRVLPFKMDVRTTRDGFELSFRGIGGKGQPLEVQLEFPLWWLDHILAKVQAARRRR